MIAIVTDVHYRMSLALIRDCSQAGAEVITCEWEGHRDNPASPALGSLSRYVSRHVWLPEDQGVEPTLELCREVLEERGERPALLPVGAATLAAVAADRQRFDAVCGLAVPTPEQLDLFNSKERLAALAASLDVPVPKSFSMEAGESVEAFVRRLPLPCVIKPVCGGEAGPYRRPALRYRPLPGGSGGSLPPLCFPQRPGPGGTDLPSGAGWAATYWQITEKSWPPSVTSGSGNTPFPEAPPPAAAAWTGRICGNTPSGWYGKPATPVLPCLNLRRMAKAIPFAGGEPPDLGHLPLTRVTGSGIPLLWAILAHNAGNGGAPIPLPEIPVPRQKKMIFAASDLMAGLGYARRGRPGQLFAALGDFLNPAVADGLFEWGDILPGLAYYRSLITKEKRG